MVDDLEEGVTLEHVPLEGGDLKKGDLVILSRGRFIFHFRQNDFRPLFRFLLHLFLVPRRNFSKEYSRS